MKLKKIYILIFLIILFKFLHAQVSYNQQFIVNTYTNNSQYESFVSQLADGGFVVCWESVGQDGDCYGIYGQIFENNGSKIGTEFQVNTHIVDCQLSPVISFFPDSGFVVCWQSEYQDGSGYGVYGQLFENDGSKRGSEFQINSYTAGWQRFPSVNYLFDGGFIACWESGYQDGSYYGIYGQLFNSDGSKREKEFQINTYVNNDQCRPSVSTLIDSGFVVFWDSYEQDGNGFGIFGQLFNRDGSKRGKEFQINTYIDSDQRYVKSSGLTEGGFIVCWESYGQDGYFEGIYGQLFENSGLKHGLEFMVNSYTISRQTNPSVSCLTNGGFVICWVSHGQNGNPYGIYCQIFNNDGSKLGSEFRVNEFPQNSWHDRPKVSGLNNGGFAICWDNIYSYGGDPEWDVYCKYYKDEPLIHSLMSYSLLKPLSDTTTKNISPTFRWNQASALHINFPWELEYTIYLDDNNDFMHPQIISGIYDTTCVVDSLSPGTTYFWKVLAKNIENDSLWSTETNMFYVSEDATSIEHPVSQNPSDFKLFANYPNPFNPETTIKYNLPADQSVYQLKVKIYDALGQLINTLINKPQNPGFHTVKWNGKNRARQNMPSGIYFCVVEAEQFKATQKMLLVR